jgi:hypothetical protein
MNVGIDLDQQVARLKAQACWIRISSLRRVTRLVWDIRAETCLRQIFWPLYLAILRVNSAY